MPGQCIKKIIEYWHVQDCSRVWPACVTLLILILKQHTIKRKVQRFYDEYA